MINKIDIKIKKSCQHVAGELLRWFLAAVFFLPFLWLLLMSFKSPEVAFRLPPPLFFVPNLDGYRELFQRIPFGRYMINTIITSVVTVLISLLMSIPAAYTFSRFKLRSKGSIALAVLLIKMAPGIAIVIPLFVISSFIGILDTRLVLIVTYLSFTVPFTFWMLQGFFQQVPMAVEEAAFIDGCTRWMTLWTITLPIIRSGIAATATLCFIQAWNQFLYALFLTSTQARTLPTIVMLFSGYDGVMWGQMSAASGLILAPVVIIAIAVRKHIVTGLTMGSIK